MSWKPIANYGVKREDAPEEHQWKRLGAVLYNAEDHKCSIVTDIISFGTFYALPFNQDNAPRLEGDILVFNGEYESEGVTKKKYDSIGKIISHQDETGKISYQIELWGTSVTSIRNSEKGGLWQSVFLDDREVYQATRFNPEDENQDAPVTQWKPQGPPPVQQAEMDESDDLPF